MRVLPVHPSALMYSELYLRLEPIGLERRVRNQARARRGIVTDVSGAPEAAVPSREN